MKIIILLVFMIKLKYSVTETRIFGADRYIEIRAMFPGRQKGRKRTKEKKYGMTTEKYRREIEERIFLEIYWPFRTCKSAAERIR